MPCIWLWSCSDKQPNHALDAEPPIALILTSVWIGCGLVSSPARHGISLLTGPASVDHQQAPGHIAGSITGEKDGGPLNLFEASPPA